MFEYCCPSNNASVFCCIQWHDKKILFWQWLQVLWYLFTLSSTQESFLALDSCFVCWAQNDEYLSHLHLRHSGFKHLQCQHSGRLGSCSVPIKFGVWESPLFVLFVHKQTMSWPQPKQMSKGRRSVTWTDCTRRSDIHNRSCVLQTCPNLVQSCIRTH